MRDIIRQIEAEIRWLQCLLDEMLWDIQMIGVRLAEMAEKKIRPLSHTQRDGGAIPPSATKSKYREDILDG